jgi:hypothetical protein
VGGGKYRLAAFPVTHYVRDHLALHITKVLDCRAARAKPSPAPATAADSPERSRAIKKLTIKPAALVARGA